MSQTCRQKRLDRQKLAQQQVVDSGEFDLSSEQLGRLQREDDSLASIRELVSRLDNSDSNGYFERDGLIYQRWVPKGRDQSSFLVEQLVVHQKCRRVVLDLAHKVPLAGNLGKNKAQKQILERYHWPNVFKDVADYCRCCVECQKSMGRRESRAPLIPLLVVSEPFERIAMDIVGPVPRSRHGYCYILVI